MARKKKKKVAKKKAARKLTSLRLSDSLAKTVSNRLRETDDDDLMHAALRIREELDERGLNDPISEQGEHQLATTFRDGSDGIVDPIDWRESGRFFDLQDAYCSLSDKSPRIMEEDIVLPVEHRVALRANFNIDDPKRTDVTPVIETLSRNDATNYPYYVFCEWPEAGDAFDAFQDEVDQFVADAVDFAGDHGLTYKAVLEELDSWYKS